MDVKIYDLVSCYLSPLEHMLGLKPIIDTSLTLQQLRTSIQEPVLCTAVCPTWRSVALATATLDQQL